MKLQSKKYGSITTESVPLTHGGAEGEVYQIKSPSSLKNSVVKLLKPHKRQLEKERKINFMLQNPPKTVNPDSIIWPCDLVYENRKFAGFIMKKADGEDLSKFRNYQSDNLKGYWKKFEHQSNQSFDVRLKLCYNIAAAISQLHSTKKYVVVDIKPENIKLGCNGNISLLDVDSIQISQNSSVLFRASASTPDYTPPEARSLNINKHFIPESWDRFGLAIMLYQMLLGIHPFVGSCRSPFEGCSEITDMINNALFPFGKKRNLFSVVPPPHNAFHKLPPEMQVLFARCFDEGHINPDRRPTATEWANTICNALKMNTAPLIAHNIPAPEILLFTATKNKIIAGENIQLKWRVRNYEKIFTSDGMTKKEMKTNSITINPRKDTTYTLEAYDKQRLNLVIKSISIKVFQPVEILSFGTKGLRNYTIDTLPVTLCWNVRGANKIHIENIGDVTGQTSYAVRPTKKTTYKVIASNDVQQKEASISIDVFPKPEIISFTATEIKILKGKSTRLQWSAKGDKIFMSDGISRNQVAGDGSEEAKPGMDTIYTLEVHSLGSLIIEKRTLSVKVFSEVEIKSFTVDKDMILEGEDVLLSWKVVNASHIKISFVGDVSSFNEKTIKPIKSTTYIITASNDLRSRSLQVTVKVFTLNHLEKPILSDHKDCILHYYDINENKFLADSVGYNLLFNGI